MKDLKRFMLISLIVIFAYGCGDKADTKGIELSIDISPNIVSSNFAEELTITDRLYMKFDFKYELKDNFKPLDKRYKVFINFIQKNNKKPFFKYEHSFNEVKIKDISKWKKGETINYSYKFYIPKFLQNYGINFDGYEPFDLKIGLFIPNIPKKNIVLFNKEIRIEAEESHAPEIDYREGWHGKETNPSAKKRILKSMRWTTDKAVCIIDNKNYKSKKPSKYLLIINGGVSKGILKDQTVSIFLNNLELDSFIPNKDFFKRKYLILPSQIGTNPTFKLIFKTDKFFIPAELYPNNTDTRKLGIKIYDIYFRKTF